MTSNGAAKRLFSSFAGPRFGLAASLVLAATMAPAVARAQQAFQLAPAPPVVMVPVAEQPRTLLSRPIHSGGYGAPVVSYTRFAGSDSVLVGGRGGWILNHQLVIGGGGFGLATPAERVGVSLDQADYRHTFGYGGLWLEYLIAPMNVVHASVGTLVGAGGISYQRFRPDMQDVESTGVFVLDPVVAVEVNVTTFLRVALQSGYRVVRGVDLATLDNSGASGFTLGGAIKFGGF
jgi:hypothetical protein